MQRRLVDLVGSGVLALALLGATALVYSGDGGIAAPSATTATAPAAAPTAERSAVETGRALFLAKGCNGCHVMAGAPGTMPFAPDLTGLAAVAGTRRPGLSAEEYVRESLLDPQAFLVPGYSGQNVGQMPRLPLSDAEVDALTTVLLAQHEGP